MHRTNAFTQIIVLALAAVTTAGAQETIGADSTRQPAKSWETGAMQIHVGAARYGIGALNTALSRTGRPTFSTSSGTVGFNAYARFGRLLLGAGGETSIGNRQVANGWTTRLSTDAVTLDAGYVVLATRNTVIYSMVSIGNRTIGLQFERQGDYSYEDALENPSRGVTLSSSVGVAQFGFSVEQHLVLPGLGMLSLGLQSGMATPLGSASTVAGETRVSSTPSQNSGSYLRVSIGKPIAARGEALGAVSAALLSMVGR